MTLVPLYNPQHGQMRVVGLMSGSGSNLCKIIEEEQRLKNVRGESPYSTVVIFSDNETSNAQKIGEKYKIPVIVNDIRQFYAKRKQSRRDLLIRQEFDTLTVKALQPYHASVAAYAGYMGIATQPLLDAFLGINVHPADLTIMEENKRKYTGEHAVRDAILAGEQQIRATTHIVEPQVDYGRILMVSEWLYVYRAPSFNPHDKNLINTLAEGHQNLLKKVGDWHIFPRTLLFLAEGYFQQDEQGNLYFLDKPIPQGINIIDATININDATIAAVVKLKKKRNKIKETEK